VPTLKRNDRTTSIQLQSIEKAQIIVPSGHDAAYTDQHQRNEENDHI
jgi:hypothetical protein